MHCHSLQVVVPVSSRKFQLARRHGLGNDQRRVLFWRHLRVLPSETRGGSTMSLNCLLGGRNNNLFDLCRPPGNLLVNATKGPGRDVVRVSLVSVIRPLSSSPEFSAELHLKFRDSVMECQLTTLLQTAVRTWTTSFFVSFFCDGLNWC